jgi:hypothetical protein
VGEDVVGDVEFAWTLKDIVAIVEGVTESQHLDGGFGSSTAAGRFRNVSEFLGIGFDGRLFQGFETA